MKETTTRWEDTGRDCPYCGGQILLRTDQQPDATLTSYYQCSQCGTQWNMNWSLMRHQQQALPDNGRSLPRPDDVPWWVWAALVALVLFVLFRLGFIALLRVAAFPFLLCFIAYLVFRTGRDFEWW